jgi:hypothetical protein
MYNVVYIITIIKLELIEHIPCVPLCIASATDGLGFIEHAQDSLVQACAVIWIGVSDVGVATMGNKKAFVTLVDRIPRFEAY